MQPNPGQSQSQPQPPSVHQPYHSLSYPVTPLSASLSLTHTQQGHSEPSHHMSRPTPSDMSYHSFDLEQLADGDVDADGESDEDQRAKGGSRSPSDTSPHDRQGDGPVRVKKPRITLARGGACVACRNRKLKCTGDKPCKTCSKAGIECRYEEIPRKKPRAVVLEERVAELETMLGLRGEHSPGQPLTPEQYSPASLARRSSSISNPYITNQPPRHSLPHRDSNGNTAQVNQLHHEVAPGSPLELALIQIVLPHTPYLLMPVHPQRLLASLSLPANDRNRPHPAFLYILYAEAVQVLTRQIPPPKPPRAPPEMFSYFAAVMPQPPADTNWVLQHVQGCGLAFLERARKELDQGIRTVDRPFDLVRAAIGIARHLLANGRFIEGWNVPVSRLVISCGLHRLTGVTVPPDGSQGQTEFLPKPYAPPHFYLHSHSSRPYVSPSAQSFPTLRMRPVIIPPPRDEIDLAERTMTFWSAKQQDWQAGTGWGWTISMADDECTTQWPWSGGSAEVKGPAPKEPFYIQDLYDPSSTMHSSPYPDTTYTLAVKSMALLHRASHLFDLPSANYPVRHPDGHVAPTYIPSLAAIREVETALQLFRSRIPPVFANPPQPSQTSQGSGETVYDGPGDPWWIQCHMNLLTAEMLMWKEMAHHRSSAYDTAVGCARAMVGLAQRLRPESWIHLDMIVALDMSLASRFLYKEASRLTAAGQMPAAAMATEEAESLRLLLAGDYGKWLPMASLHSMIVQRVKDGWSEKEGEYERV